MLSLHLFRPFLVLNGRADSESKYMLPHEVPNRKSPVFRKLVFVVNSPVCRLLLLQNDQLPTSYFQFSADLGVMQQKGTPRKPLPNPPLGPFLQGNAQVRSPHTAEKW